MNEEGTTRGDPGRKDRENPWKWTCFGCVAPKTSAYACGCPKYWIIHESGMPSPSVSTSAPFVMKRVAGTSAELAELNPLLATVDTAYPHVLGRCQRQICAAVKSNPR